MSDTPPHDAAPANGRDRTPELVSSREKRRRDDEEDDRDAQRDRSHRSSRRHRDDDERDDRDRDRESRHRRHREDETEEERRERHRRRDEETEEERRERRRRREEETEEDREERHRRRRERERGHDDRRRGSRGDSIGLSRSERERDRSRESHRSSTHRTAPPPPPRDDGRPNLKEMTREEKQAERDKRDREMLEEKREAAKLREAKFAEIDRERELERRRLRDEDRGIPRDRSPRRRRGSPSYSSPGPRDPATALLNEVERENRSIFISQLSAKLTSHDLGMFFEDKLGRGAVRDARIVTDKVSRRSKGIGYVELDAPELVNRAIALTGTIVMGLPINVMLTESERNREGPSSTPAIGTETQSTTRPAITFGHTFPPLSTGLALPPGLDVDAHRDAAIPFHRLYISNVAFSLTADDVRQVFEPFGEIEFVDLHVDFAGTKKGTGYVQYKDLASAQMALDAMAGFELAGRPIRVQTVQDRAYVATEQIEDNGNYGTRLDANQRQQLMFKLARTEPTVNLALSAHKPVAAPSRTPQMNPTPFVIVSNMFNPDEETERNWDLDLAEDVKGEVESKYGKVNRIKVEKMSAGEVYIEFGDINGATSAIKGLNGRFFGGRQLQASYISETLFKAHL